MPGVAAGHAGGPGGGDGDMMHAMPPTQLMQTWDASDDAAVAAAAASTAAAATTLAYDEYPEDDEYGEGEENVDDEDVLELVAAQDELLAPVQEAWMRKLRTQDEAYTLELREKDALSTSLKNKREQLGVELYHLQQQLAKRQLALERTHATFLDMQAQRGNVEKQRHTNLVGWQQKQQELQEWTKKYDQAKKEQDQVMKMMKQIEQYNQQVTDEIKVVRREAYGEEDLILQREREKKKQDERIDSMRSQLLEEKDRAQLIELQMKAQEKEREHALSIVKEMENEIRMMVDEKKDYLQRWKVTVQSIEKREEAIRRAQESIDEEREELRAIEQEIKASKKAIREQAEEKERQTSALQKADTENLWIERQIGHVEEVRSKLMEMWSMFEQRMERADDELKRVSVEGKHIERDVGQLTASAVKLMNQRRQLEEDRDRKRSEEKTMEVGARHMWKSIGEMKSKIAEKEMEMGDIENETARIKVDILHTAAHNQDLKSTLAAYMKELQEKDALIERYEHEIENRHDKIEKKQIYIASLNRKYEQIMLKARGEEGEELGPLEATIYKIKKEIENQIRQKEESEKEWIKIQSELVSIVTRKEEEEDVVREMHATETVKARKMRLLEEELNAKRLEQKEMDSTMRAMHADLARLNEMIADEEKERDEKERQNFHLEREYMVKLREREAQSHELESLIARLRVEKDQLMTQVLEVERQLLLWEKKIQLERETQAALDPSVGQKEVHEMKKEVKRMKERAKALAKHQKQLVADMVRTIDRSAAVSVTATLRPKDTEAKTVRQLTDQINKLKDEVRVKSSEMKLVLEEKRRQEQENAVMTVEVQKLQAAWGAMKQRKEEVEVEVNEKRLERRILLEQTILRQKRAKMYDDLTKRVIAQGNGAGNEEDDEANMSQHQRQRLRAKLTSDLESTEDKQARLRAGVERLCNENPRFEGLFQKVLALF